MMIKTRIIHRLWTLIPLMKVLGRSELTNIKILEFYISHSCLLPPPPPPPWSWNLIPLPLFLLTSFGYFSMLMEPVFVKVILMCYYKALLSVWWGPMVPCVLIAEQPGLDFEVSWSPLRLHVWWGPTLACDSGTRARNVPSPRPLLSGRRRWARRRLRKISTRLRNTARLSEWLLTLRWDKKYSML